MAFNIASRPSAFSKEYTVKLQSLESALKEFIKLITLLQDDVNTSHFSKSFLHVAILRVRIKSLGREKTPQPLETHIHREW